MEGGGEERVQGGRAGEGDVDERRCIRGFEPPGGEKRLVESYRHFGSETAREWETEGDGMAMEDCVLEGME